MGVKWLLRWKPAKGHYPSATDESLLIQALEAFQARQIGSKERKFEVACSLLKQSQPPHGTVLPPTATGGLKDMWLIRSSDASETCYLLNRRDHLVIESDVQILNILQQKLEYQIRSVVRLEGSRYNKGDFHIKLGTALQTVMGISGQQVLLGSVLEIEYSPVAHPEVAAPVLAEFVEALRTYLPQPPSAELDPSGTTGRLEVLSPSFDKYKSLPAAFSHSHAAVMYAELAVTLISQQE